MPKEWKLNWTVQYDEDQNIKRRKAEGDTLLMDHIDVVWTHPDGFPPTTEVQPVSFDYATKEIKYKTVEVGERRDKILDQLTVSPDTSDFLIIKQLESKRAALAASLGVEP
jgi:hypothetical protein